MRDHRDLSPILYSWIVLFLIGSARLIACLINDDYLDSPGGEASQIALAFIVVAGAAAFSGVVPIALCIAHLKGKPIPSSRNTIAALSVVLAVAYVAADARGQVDCIGGLYFSVPLLTVSIAVSLLSLRRVAA